MKASQYFLFGMLFILLVGCVATTQLSVSKSKPVPSDRILDNRYVTPFVGSANIVIKRDDGFYGSGCDSVFYINNMKVAIFRPGEFLRVYVKPGNYILGATQGCGQDAIVTVEADVKSGDVKTFRMEANGVLGELATFRFMPTNND